MFKEKLNESTKIETLSDLNLALQRVCHEGFAQTPVKFFNSGGLACLKEAKEVVINATQSCVQIKFV